MTVTAPDPLYIRLDVLGIEVVGVALTADGQEMTAVIHGVWIFPTGGIVFDWVGGEALPLISVRFVNDDGPDDVWPVGQPQAGAWLN